MCNYRSLYGINYQSNYKNEKFEREKEIDILKKEVKDMKPIYETTNKEREELTKFFTKKMEETIKKYEERLN